MRITSELLSQAEQRTNPLQDRELVLREYGIPDIENLAIVGDEFDAMDLSDNRLTRLENFPRLRRLKHLYCGGNLIDSLHAKNIQSNLPNLQTLILTQNNIASLAQVAHLGEACPHLEFLSLTGNPVTRRQYYRLYTIHKLPTLKVLDYSRVKAEERDRAERLAASAAGAALAADIQVEARQQRVKTFVPGESGDEGRSFVVSLTDEQREQMRELLASASSAKEVEEIEASIRRGVLPATLKRKRDEAASNRVSDEEDAATAKKART